MNQTIESAQEEKIIADLETGKYQSLDKKEFLELETSLKKAASNTIEKLSRRKAINIRLLESDIERLKAMALHEGMAYQTYISHMIHKLTTGRLKAI